MIRQPLDHERAVEPMLERVVPPFVACAETTRDIDDAPLFPSERAALGRSVEQRRREFTTGRACARLALQRLGRPAVAIPSGPRGEPVWPAGIIGSITHCRGFRACAVARRESAVSIGIDAEPNEALPAGVMQEVLHGPERDIDLRRGRGPDALHLPRLVFSAKEAVYKAWFPMTSRWLDFEDIEVSLDPSTETFRARLLVGNQDEFSGRWAMGDGIICTAVVVLVAPPAEPRWAPPRPI